MEEGKPEVAEIKNNAELSYLQKLEKLGALREKSPFTIDEAFMRKFAEGENLDIVVNEAVTVVWKKVQDYNDVLEKYKLPNIHTSDFNQIQETLKLRAANEIPAKINEVIQGEGTYLSKLKKLKGLYWSYRGLGEIKPTDFFCSESELNIDSQDNVKALAQLAEYKTLFQLLDIEVPNFAAFKQAEEIVQQRVQEKYNHDIEAILNSSGSPLEKLKAAKEVFDRNDANKFLTHEKMAALVDVLKAIEFSSDANYIDQLAQLKEYQVFCAGLKLAQGVAVIKEKIENLKFDLNAAVVLVEIQSIDGNSKLSAAEKLSRLNLLLGRCSENGVKLSSATQAYFNEAVKELSNQVAAQLIDTSRQKFLEIDWDIFSKDPTKTSVTKYAADLTMFVQKTILGNTNKVAASLSIGQWLHIANECVKNRDYHSAHAICQAFTASAVDRVMAIVATEEEKQILDQLRILFPAKESAVSRLATAESAQAEKDVVPSLIYPATQIGNTYAAAEGTGGKADPDVLAKIMSSSQDIQRNSGIPKKKEFNEMRFGEFVSDDGLYALSLETMPRLDDEGKQREKERIAAAREGLNTFLAADEKELSALVHPFEVRMIAAQVFKVFDNHVSKGVKEKAEKDRRSFIDRIVELDVGNKPKLTEESKSTSSKEINRKIGEIKELLLKVESGVHNEELKNKMIDLVQALELKAKTTKSGEGKKSVIERNIQILRAIANECGIDIPKADFLAETDSLQVGAPIQKPSLFSNVFSAVSRVITGIFSPAPVPEVSSAPAPSIPAPPSPLAVVQEQAPPVFLPKPTADEFLAAVQGRLSKGKDEADEGDIFTVHAKICEHFKIRFPNVEVEKLKNMNEAEYEELIRGEFENGRVQGETTQVTEKASKTPEQKKLDNLNSELDTGVNGLLKELYTSDKAKFFENFNKHFLVLGQKIDKAKSELGFTAQDVADLFKRLQEFVQHIEEINKQEKKSPLEKAEEIAAFVEKNPGFYLDANNAKKWAVALSDEFPEALINFSPDAGMRLDSFVVKFVQWLPKYPGHLERYGSLPQYRGENSETNQLGKRFDAICKQFNLALEQVEGESELAKLAEKPFRLKKSSTISAKEINEKFNKVHANIKLLNRDQLDGSGKVALLRDIDALLEMYAKKLSGGTSAENKKTIVNNIPALLFFAKQLNPLYQNDEVLKQLGTNIASLGREEGFETSSVALLLKMETVVPRKQLPPDDEVMQILNKALEDESRAELSGAMLETIQEGELLYDKGDRGEVSLGEDKKLRDRSLKEIVAQLIKNPAGAEAVFGKKGPYRAELLKIENLHLVESMILVKGSNGEILRQKIKETGLLDSSHMMSSSYAKSAPGYEESVGKKELWQVRLKVLLEPSEAQAILSSEKTQGLFKKHENDAISHINDLIRMATEKEGISGLRSALIQSGILDVFDKNVQRKFISVLQQHFEEVVIEGITDSATLQEKLKEASFREDLKWHPSQIDRLKKIPDITEEQKQLLDALKESATNKSGKWCKGDFYLALHDVTFSNKKMQAHFLRNLENIGDKLPEIKAGEEANALYAFIKNHLSKFTGAAAYFGNYDAMIRNAPKNIKNAVENLFKLNNEQYIEMQPPSDKDIEDIPGYGGLDFENWKDTSKVSSQQRNEEKLSVRELEEIFEKIRDNALQKMLKNNVREVSVSKADLVELNAFVEAINKAFEDKFLAYEEYQALLERAPKFKEAFTIEETRYQEIFSFLRGQEALGGAAEFINAPSNPVQPGQTVEMEEVVYGKPSAKKAPEKKDKAGIFDRLKAAVAPKGGAVEQIEKIARENATLSPSKIKEVNKLLEGFAKDVNAAREKSGNHLFYPADDMSRIVKALAKHYQAPGLNIAAIQGMFPSVDAVNKYLKQEEAKLDAMIDVLDPEDFAEIFAPYFHPEDKKYDSHYQGRGVAPEAYKRQVLAYTFKDIIKRSFTIGIESHGGQGPGGSTREAMAESAANEFLNKTKDSDSETIQLVRALLNARSALARLNVFAAAPGSLAAPLLEPLNGSYDIAVDAAKDRIELPARMVSEYHAEFSVADEIYTEYSVSKGIQNEAFDIALAKVISEGHFGDDVTDTDELSKDFVKAANEFVGKDAKMPDAFLENCMGFVELIEGKRVDGKWVPGEIVNRQGQLDARKALILAVVKGDIDYELNAKDFKAIDAHLLNAKRYQAELKNAMKVLQRKFRGTALLESDALTAEEKRVERHIQQLTSQVNQIQVARPKLIKEFEKLENATLRSCLEKILHDKGMTEVPGNLKKAVGDINALLRGKVVPTEFISHYKEFLKILADNQIHFLSDSRGPFMVALVMQNMEFEPQDFSAQIKNISTLALDDQNALSMQIKTELEQSRQHAEYLRAAIDYFEKEVPAERGEELSALRAQHEEVARAIAELEKNKQAIKDHRTTTVVTMEIEAVTVKIDAAVRISMTKKSSSAPSEKSEKPKQDSVIVYHPDKRGDAQFERISGDKAQIQEALESGNHAFTVKNDGVSYTQPDGVAKLSDSQLRVLVQEMVKETYNRFEPKSIKDITFEGSEKLQKIAKEMMQTEISNALRAAKGKEEMESAKTAEPKSKQAPRAEK